MENKEIYQDLQSWEGRDKLQLLNQAFFDRIKVLKADEKIIVQMRAEWEDFTGKLAQLEKKVASLMNEISGSELHNEQKSILLTQISKDFGYLNNL